MKKILFCGIIMLSMFLSGCNRSDYSCFVIPNETYTVIQNGVELNNLKCISWSMLENYTEFMTEDGKKVIVKGSFIIIEE